MQNTNLILSTFIEAEKMNNKIKETLFQSIQKKYENTCSENNGYIINIVKLNNIIDSKLSEDVQLHFTCNCNVNILKPSVKDQIKFKVTMMFIHGIFCQLNNLKVLIPHDQLKKFTFDSKNKIYISEDKKTEIKINDEIIVEIIDIRYKKKNFNCIGKIIFKD